MKMMSYKKPRLMGSIFTPKTKLMRCRRREKEDTIPGQKVGRRNSLWQQLRDATPEGTNCPPCSSDMLWPRLCLHREEPLLMVSQGNLVREARRALLST